MKVIVTGCSHIGRMHSGYDWRKDMVAAFDDIIEKSHRADLLIHMGDLFDTGHPSPKDYDFAYQILDEIDCPTVLMKGNHDENPGLEPDAIFPIRRVKFRRELSIIQDFGVKAVDGKVFAFFGYFNDSKIRNRTEGEIKTSQEALDGFFDALKRKEYFSPVDGRLDDVCLLCTHIDVTDLGYSLEDDSSRRVGARIKMEQLQSLPFPVMVGHIHKPKWIKPNVYIPGSLLPFDFSEVGQQHFCASVEV